MREMAAFTDFELIVSEAQGRVPVATNSGAGRTRARSKAPANTKSGPPSQKKIGTVSLTTSLR